MMQIVLFAKMALNRSVIGRTGCQHELSKASFYKWKAKYSGHVGQRNETAEGIGRRKSAAEKNVCQLESGT